MPRYTNLTAKEIQKSVRKKLELKNVETTRETRGEYWCGGKLQFKVTMPNVHGGSGSVSHTMLGVCKRSLRLSTKQFTDLVNCPMSGEEYEMLIRDKIKDGDI